MTRDDRIEFLVCVLLAILIVGGLMGAEILILDAIG